MYYYQLEAHNPKDGTDRIIIHRQPTIIVSCRKIRSIYGTNFERILTMDGIYIRPITKIWYWIGRYILRYTIVTSNGYYWDLRFRKD